jgi:hypothetical protein
MILVPILVALLVRVNKTYKAEDEQLVIGPEDRAADRDQDLRHTAFLVVNDVESHTLHAAQYAFTIRPTSIRALHLGVPDHDLALRWSETGLRILLEAVPCDEGPGRCISDYVRAHSEAGAQVTIIVPAPAEDGVLGRVRRAREWSSIAAATRSMPNVGVVVVRDHGGPGHQVAQGRVQVAPRRRHVAVILVETLDRAVLKAARYARGIDAMDVRAVHAANDPDRAERVIDQWLAFGYLAGIPLDVEECHDRNIERSLRRYVARFEEPGAEVTLILPRRHFSKRRHFLLHDRTSRRIARAFAEEAHVDVVVVPYVLGEGSDMLERPETRPAPV